MSAGTIPGPSPAMAQANRAAAQKRPIEATNDNVGPPTVSSQAQDNVNASDSAMSGERPSRPVFKMRRTGHSGAFPVWVGPISPLIPQSPTVTDAASNSIGKHDTSSPSISCSSSAPSPSLFSESPPQEPEKAVSSGLLTPSDGNETVANAAQTEPKPAIGHAKDMSSQQVFTPITANRETAPSTSGSAKAMPPDVKQLFASALDDRPYRTWTDASGVFATDGALLPSGY
ncbi:hypothetical protein N658DRAFT_56628 [Parathielavia hyrcaniae]|uniref:Uncharacterized protein n=1 Tax=Parathielavia hyrcaniae TaxID=113614 RepID=A0AAN6PQG5_9PEZI|nr:hypothetical protein N658DRAFT_56628 [Parathielavia hyrcaniae]